MKPIIPIQRDIDHLSSGVAEFHGRITRIQHYIALFKTCIIHSNNYFVINNII